MNGRARVEIIEIDLSSRVPSFPGVYGSMVLDTSKGDVLEPRLATSGSELFRRFMSTDKILPRDPLGLFEAEIFLQKSNKLWVVRPDTGATYGGAYLAQDIPVSSAAVSVNQGVSAVFLRSATEGETEWSKFIYSTISDGDAVQFEGALLPAGLEPDTNYFVIKYSEEKMGLRLAPSQEAALEGEYLVLTSSGVDVVMKFTPDDVNGEQQYPVRNPAGYELNTGDGKAAGFTTTFTVDIEGDYLNVTREFYDSAETGDSVVLTGTAEDLPQVDSGLPLTTTDTYYLIKVPQEGVNADKYKVQIAKSEAAALSEEPIGLSSAGGPFGLSFKGKTTTSAATIDIDTDLVEVSKGFYDLVKTGDLVRAKATVFPTTVARIQRAFPDNSSNNASYLRFDYEAGSSLSFYRVNKVPGLLGTDVSDTVALGWKYKEGQFIGIWYDKTVDTDTHFGVANYDGTNFTVVTDFCKGDNAFEAWKVFEYTLETRWSSSDENKDSLLVEVNFTGFKEGSWLMSAGGIMVGSPFTIIDSTNLFAIRPTTGTNSISLSAEPGGNPIDFIEAGEGVQLEMVNKSVTVYPTVDLSLDSFGVSETFYEQVDTGYKLAISSDGILPGGLTEGEYFTIKTRTPKTIKLASTLGNALAGIPVDILNSGTLDPVQNEYHHILDKHNDLYTGYKRRVGYLHTSTPTDEELYYKLYHYPYGKEEDWNDFDQSCADLVKEPGAFLVILYKKYEDQYLEVERKTCSRNPEHMDGYGRNIYVEKVFGSSNYVRWIDNKAVDTSVYPCNQTTYAKLTGGSLGHSATTGECITALRLLGNKRRYPVTLIMDAGWSIPAYQQAIIDVCESRGSTLGILSTPIEHEQSSNYLEDIIAYRRKSLITSTSHAALYTPHVKVYDRYNDREIYISPTGHVGACISETAANYEPWFAPAGNRRGVLNVLGVTREFNDGDEDAIYDAGINPIDFHETHGIRIWGQKTLLTRASALDRVNVRMLLIVIEPAIEALLMDYVFEINDEFSRSMIVSKISPYLASIKARRGLYDYSVICDESNNTPEVIDANELVVDMPIQPVRVGELLRGRLFINSTGASFTIV